MLEWSEQVKIFGFMCRLMYRPVGEEKKREGIIFVTVRGNADAREPAFNHAQVDLVSMRNRLQCFFFRVQ